MISLRRIRSLKCWVDAFIFQGHVNAAKREFEFSVKMGQGVQHPLLT